MMQNFKKILLIPIMAFFTACGTSEHIDSNRGFDMWEYMTSSLNYEVEYAIYENNAFTDYYTETQRNLGDQYVRESNTGVTRLLLSSRQILMQEPSENVEIERYVYLGDSGVFRSPSFRLCTVENFHNNYQTQGQIFYNVLEIACTSNSGFYQEFYYGYNEGIVSIYQKDGQFEKEYVKVSERRIF